MRRQVATRRLPALLFVIPAIAAVVLWQAFTHKQPPPARILYLEVDPLLFQAGQAILQAYETDHPDVVGLVVPSGNGAAEKSTEATLLRLTYALPEANSDFFTALAYDLVVIVCNEHLTNQDCSDRGLKDITSGQASNDSQGLSLTPVLYPHGDTFREAVSTAFVPPQEYAASALVAPDPATLINIISQNQNAVGFVPASYFTSQGFPEALKTMAIGRFAGQTAFTDERLNDAYRLQVPVYILSEGEPQGEDREFLNWLLSEAGQQSLSPFLITIR